MNFDQLSEPETSSEGDYDFISNPSDGDDDSEHESISFSDLFQDDEAEPTEGINAMAESLLDYSEEVYSSPVVSSSEDERLLPATPPMSGASAEEISGDDDENATTPGNSPPTHNMFLESDDLSTFSLANSNSTLKMPLVESGILSTSTSPPTPPDEVLPADWTIEDDHGYAAKGLIGWRLRTWPASELLPYNSGDAKHPQGVVKLIGGGASRPSVLRRLRMMAKTLDYSDVEYYYFNFDSCTVNASLVLEHWTFGTAEAGTGTPTKLGSPPRNVKKGSTSVKHEQLGKVIEGDGLVLTLFVYEQDYDHLHQSEFQYFLDHKVPAFSVAGPQRFKPVVASKFGPAWEDQEGNRYTLRSEDVKHLRRKDVHLVRNSLTNLVGKAVVTQSTVANYKRSCSQTSLKDSKWIWVLVTLITVILGGYGAQTLLNMQSNPATNLSNLPLKIPSSSSVADLPLYTLTKSEEVTVTSEAATVTSEAVTLTSEEKTVTMEGKVFVVQTEIVLGTVPPTVRKRIVPGAGPTPLPDHKEPAKNEALVPVSSYFKWKSYLSQLKEDSIFTIGPFDKGKLGRDVKELIATGVATMTTYEDWLIVMFESLLEDMQFWVEDFKDEAVRIYDSREMYLDIARSEAVKRSQEFQELSDRTWLGLKSGALYALRTAGDSLKKVQNAAQDQWSGVDFEKHGASVRIGAGNLKNAVILRAKDLGKHAGKVQSCVTERSQALRLKLEQAYGQQFLKAKITALRENQKLGEFQRGVSKRSSDLKSAAMAAWSSRVEGWKVKKEGHKISKNFKGHSSFKALSRKGKLVTAPKFNHDSFKGHQSFKASSNKGKPVNAYRFNHDSIKGHPRGVIR